jgi:hypothetical protein
MEGLALSVEKARQPNGSVCIPAGFACRVFDLNRRDGATSSLDQEADLLPTWNEATENPEPAQRSLWPREAPTQRRRLN